MSENKNTESTPVIEIRSLGRTFGKKKALDGVHLSVARGGVFGLVGANGAGKTTLIKHMLGLFGAQAGYVRVFGLDPVADPVGVLSRIGYLSEDRDMPDWMAVQQLMNYTQAFYPGWDTRFADELRQMFALDPKSKVRDLSRGERAKMGLLLALAHRPELLLLDEPSSGLDPVVRRDILSAIIRTVADEGRTVLFSSHLLDEVERVADHVAMIQEGRIVLDASTDDIRSHHTGLVIRFENPLRTAPIVPGCLHIEGADKEWRAICNSDRATAEAEIVRIGGTVVEHYAPTLEDVFVARVQQKGAGHEIASGSTR